MFFKDDLINSYKVNHKMIEALIMLIEARTPGVGNINYNLTERLDDVAKSYGNYLDNKKSIRYLIASGYFFYIKKADDEHIGLTGKGLFAYNSDLYQTKYRELLKVRNNNRWMLLFNGVVAAGVIYSIWNNDSKEYPPTKDKKVYSLIRR